MAFAEVVLKLTLVIFMVGNLLDMGLRLHLSNALRGLHDLRFVIWSILWGFVLLPGFAYAIAWCPYSEGAAAHGRFGFSEFMLEREGEVHELLAESKSASVGVTGKHLGEPEARNEHSNSDFRALE